MARPNSQSEDHVGSPVGKTISRYRVEELLGSGGMGAVYRARDERLDRAVALKILSEDALTSSSARQRFVREAQLAATLNHPNIVTIYEVEEADGYHFIAMEYVEGETLLELERRSGPVLAVDVVIHIAADVLRGLEGAHAKGIIHRDIKPANILIAADGTAKIADFGIARPLESSMTRAGSLMGTPNYMSPEQASGKDLTTKADIFSLGVALYESLTGTKPFTAADLPTIMNNIINQPVQPLPGPIGDVISRMMAKSPEERPNASQALAQLQTPASPAVRIGAATWLTAAVAMAAIVASFFISSGSATSDIRAIRELNEKRRALAEAQRLYDQGKYKDSLQRYETYLRKYPMSTVAQNGRDRARATLVPPKPRRRPRRDEDISARELLHRFRKAIRGK